MKELNVLVIGLDTSALAASAYKAGYNVFAVDYFGDQDLRKVCKKVASIVSQMCGKPCGRIEADFSPQKLLDEAEKLIATHPIDVALLASGLENSPRVLTELNKLIPIIGNTPIIIKRTCDKTRFFHELEKLSINHPQSSLAKDIEEAKLASKDIGYPIIVKPLASLGGTNVRKAKSRNDLIMVFPQVYSSSPEGVLIQEFVPGMDASVSFLSSKGETTVLTLNEQLLGIREVGQKEPFGYCGNVVPAFVDRELIETCREVTLKIASHFNLLGSNGVDMVISKEGIPYVVEVNPRFQGTLECVERVLRLNLVNAHMMACLEGSLPTLGERSLSCCVRLILYALQPSIIPNLADFKEIRDIPVSGAIIEEGEPLCSVVVEGKTRASALKKARAMAKRVYSLVKPSK
ncbi:MAG: ATP-grasp domain-containing protein [Candidatus Bathyarchaeota archaeon]|nr:MAG: ATP-grasp domain-containing protein [Candidatus Bathyarchaeota archaeon]